MNRLAMFVPLAKADAVTRMVYGYFDETPDRSGEVFDYVTSKPQIQSWSDEFVKATDGRSAGNIRAQHGNVAAGKLVELTFDDDLKKVGFAAKIVDDNEWQKVEEGVYTGFSPGGRYAKRWQDGAHRRYTAEFRELSIVDVPCNPAAAFTMVKADGVEEQIEFVMAKAYEPGNDATKARAEEMAKAANGTFKDFVVQARADLIAENATAELAKMHGDEPPASAVTPLDTALAKADAAVAAANAASAALAQAQGPFSNLTLVGPALLQIAEPIMAKGIDMYSVKWLATILSDFSCLQSSVTWEEKYDDDNPGMKLATQAADIVSKMGALLIAMAKDSVADMIAYIQTSGIVVEPAEGMDMALATQIVDFVKAETSVMEKAAMRVTWITPSVSVELQAENERLTKSLEAVTPRVEALTKALETVTSERAVERVAATKLQADFDEMSKRAEPAKGVLIVVDKEADGVPSDNLAKADDAPLTFHQRLAKLPPGPARAKFMLERK